MDFAQLTIFRAVAREGGISRAAERLNRVQSNVTTRLRQFEQDLGVELFIRKGKRLHLSPAGQVMLDYADRLLDLAQEARDAVQDSEPRGKFRLGAMESIAAVWLPGPLSEYHRLYPAVTFELRTGNPQTLAAAILTGRIDAALVAEPVAAEPFDRTHIRDEELVIVAPSGHPPVTARGIPPDTIVAFEMGCPHRKRLEDWYARRGAMPARTIEMSSYHAILGCVVAGMGIALMPRNVLTTFPESKRLSIHPLPAGQDRSKISLIWRKGAHSPKTQMLADLLRAEEKVRRTR